MRETPRTAIDVNDLACDVAGAWRAQKRDQNRQVFGLTDVSGWRVFRDPFPAGLLSRRDAPVDQLQVDAPRLSIDDLDCLPFAASCLQLR